MRSAVADVRPLVLAGAPARVAELRAALVEGGDPSALRDASGRALAPSDLEGADVLVYVIDGVRPSGEDEAALRLVDRRRVDVVCVVVAPVDVVAVPYVPASDVVVVRPEDALPLEAIVGRIAERAGETGFALAAKLPALRRAVCDGIVRRVSRQNAVLGAAIFIPGADLPALTLNQLRMILQIAAAYGEEIDRERALELVAVLGAGFGFRALARQAVAFVPGPGWAAKGGIAYAGTRAVGHAAIRYFEAGGSRRMFPRGPKP